MNKKTRYDKTVVNEAHRLKAKGLTLREIQEELGPDGPAFQTIGAWLNPRRKGKTTVDVRPFSKISVEKEELIRLRLEVERLKRLLLATIG